MVGVVVRWLTGIPSAVTAIVTHRTDIGAAHTPVECGPDWSGQPLPVLALGSFFDVDESARLAWVRRTDS